MAQRHWLDPLARRLLIATGQMEPPQPSPPPSPPPPGRGGDGPAQNLDVERELLALRLRQNPALAPRHAQDVALMAELGWRLDVNRATAADWLRLPGCTPDQVDLLLRLRAGGVQLSGPEDLQRLLELDEERLQCWRPLLEFRWYAAEDPPSAERLDLNLAPPADLQRRLPAWSQERVQRLVRERRRRPFQDLADLQGRLELPPAAVEELIGKVRFGQAPPGPALPPPLSRRGSS